MKKKKGLPAGKQGFTIIEVMVVIFIVGILSSILVVNWRKNEKTYLIQRTAQEIAQNIRKAQDLALTSKKYTGQEVPSFYGIHFSINTPTTYFVFGDVNGNQTYQSSDFKINNADIFILSGAQIDSLSAGDSLDIAFSIPDGFTYINSSHATTTTTIKIKKTGTSCTTTICKEVIIKNTGQISIQ